VSEYLYSLTQTYDVGQNLNAVEEFIRELKISHKQRLREAAYDDLTAYAEYINPDEPPAHHHHYLCNKLMEAERGDLLRMAVSMPPGAAKPLAIDTKIRMGDGTLKYLDEVLIGDEVISHTGNSRKVLEVHKQGKLPSYLLKTKHGRVIRGAADHPFLTPYGYVNLSELKIGTTLKVQRSNQYTDNSNHSVDDFYLAGYTMMNGLNREVVAYEGTEFERTNIKSWMTFESSSMKAVMRQTFRNLGIRTKPNVSEAIRKSKRLLFKDTDFYDWCKDNQMFFNNSKERLIPDWIFRGSKEKIAAFLVASLDCDGTWSTKKGIALTTTNKFLMEDYQRLFHMIGASPKLHHTHIVRVSNEYDAYKIVFYDKKSYVSLLHLAERHSPRLYIEDDDTIEKVSSFQELDFVEDEVLSVEKLNIEEEMMCLTVDVDHTFLAEDIVVHNSTYCSRLYPSWFLGRNPRKKFIQAGHTQNFVESQFGKKTRDILDSQEFQDVFPEVRLATDSRAAGLWSLNNPYGGYAAKGVGQGIAGYRAHMAVVDDPVGSRADAESELNRKNLFDWFSADFTTRLLPGAPMFIVATRWHPDDLIGRVQQMNKEGKGIPYEIVNISAICEEEPDPLGRKIGECLWPEFTPISFYLNLKETLPSRDWSSLYGSNPVNSEGALVKSEWFQRYIGNIKNEVPNLRITLSVDTASKTNERNDYTVILVWLQDTGGKHYLLDVVRKKLEFPEMCQEIDETARRWNASAILVEDKGSGTQYIQTRQGKAPAPIIAVAVNQNSKDFRFDAVTPMFEAGLVHLPERSSWLTDYETELLSFPLAKHDDQVDATSQYLSWARGKQNFGGTSKISNGHNGSASDSRARQAEAAFQKMMEGRAASRISSVNNN
jgi:predicted phage terminase large subunit-like protein